MFDTNAHQFPFTCNAFKPSKVNHSLKMFKQVWGIENRGAKLLTSCILKRTTRGDISCCTVIIVWRLGKPRGVNTRLEGLNGFVIGFTRTDTDTFFDVGHKNLSITNLTRASTFDDGFDDFVYEFINNDHFDFNFW